MPRLLRRLAAAIALIGALIMPMGALGADDTPTPPASLTAIFNADHDAVVVDYPEFINAVNANTFAIAAISENGRWVVAQDAKRNLAAAQVPAGSNFTVPAASTTAAPGDDANANAAEPDASPATETLPTAFELPAYLAERNITVLTPPASATESSGGMNPIMRFLLLPLGIAAFFATIIVVMLVVRRLRGATGGGGGRGGIQGHGKMRKEALAARPDVRFADIAGCEECVEELQETVQFLSDPERFAAVGARMPHGVILHGPPGTGKTLLAKAVAGEAGVPFYAISGSDFVDTYVGVGAARVRDLFARMRNHKDGAVLFVDEIDAIGRARGNGQGGSDTEREGTLNALLVELDGFATTDRIVVMAATNRLDILDAALIRPGRFDRHVQVSLPAARGRREILSVHAAGKPLADLTDLDDVARVTAGFSGADLAKLMNEAAIMAARDGRSTIVMADLQEGMLRAIAGPQRKDRAIADGELERIAWHEAGHALSAELCASHAKTQRVTILPRGQAAGLAMYGATDSTLVSPEQLHERMVVIMAGRAAEQLRFGNVSSGAANDLEQANGMARHAVETLGFSGRVGQIITGARGQALHMSDDMRRNIDEEIARMVEDAYSDALALLSAHHGHLERLAAALLEQQQLDRSQLTEVLGDLEQRPLSRTPVWRPHTTPALAPLPEPAVTTDGHSAEDPATNSNSVTSRRDTPQRHTVRGHVRDAGRSLRGAGRALRRAMRRRRMPAA